MINDCVRSRQAGRARPAVALLLLLEGVLGVGGCARPLLGPPSTPRGTDSTPSTDNWAWARCLSGTVRDGLVDYSAIAGQRDGLNAVLAELASGPEPNDHGAPRTARLINAYNALAMRAGLERYLATGGNMRLARAPAENEYEFRLHGRPVTLAGIHDQVLRAGGGDPRVLFTLCPASLGVALSDQPYQPDVLEQQLLASAARAINTPEVVRIDHENQTLWIAERISRHRGLLVAWYERRTGARGARLFDALLDLADDGGRQRLNTAVGYAVGVLPAERRLNVYVAPTTK
jgi:hypothetical protein